MDDLHKGFKTIKENPPLRNQILSNIHWGAKVGSAIHAGLQGYLMALGIPQKMESIIDSLVEREYNDQITQWEANKESLLSLIHI